MPTAKDIVLRPIDAAEANALVRRVHYSGKVVRNSQLHIGVFVGGRLEGAMQFGPPLDKRKMLPMVTGTEWHQMAELNRMAFSEALPRNSESRALAVAVRLLAKHAPQLKWIVTFADGTQCGDGTIYRAAGFLLTAIKRNDQVWEAPGEDAGPRFSRTSLTDGRSKGQQSEAWKRVRTFSRKSLTGQGTQGGAQEQRAAHAIGGTCGTGGATMRPFIEAGFRPLPGFQLRYIRFIDPTWRDRLTVPVLPYSAIDEAGARMYRGQRAAEPTGVGPDDQSGQGGSTPTRPLPIEAA